MFVAAARLCPAAAGWHAARRSAIPATTAERIETILEDVPSSQRFMLVRD